MKIYKMMIKPDVTYSSETWTLTAKDENNLCIFERQILRKILDFKLSPCLEYSMSSFG
jgi:hypothetical protein